MTNKKSDSAEKLIGDFSPKLVELTDQVLFDDIWERKELSKRDRSLITVAALIALNSSRPVAVSSWAGGGKWSERAGADRDHYSSGVLRRLAQCDDGGDDCKGVIYERVSGQDLKLIMEPAHAITVLRQTDSRQTDSSPD
jgi:hypothetical protein